MNPELSEAFAVTPSDSADLPDGYVRAFSANAAGNIAYTTTGGSSGTLTVVAGTIYYLRIARIKATGTTATGIYGYR